MINKSSFLSKAFLFCFIPLLIGGCVYVFFRTGGLLGFSIAGPGRIDNQLWRGVINVLPDFCWAFSLVNALYLFAAYQQVGFWKTTWFALFLIIISETVQLLLPGSFTFDWFDLFAAIAAFLLSFLYFKRNHI